MRRRRTRSGPPRLAAGPGGRSVASADDASPRLSCGDGRHALPVPPRTALAAAPAPVRGARRRECLRRPRSDDVHGTIRLVRGAHAGRQPRVLADRGTVALDHGHRRPDGLPPSRSDVRRLAARRRPPRLPRAGRWSARSISRPCTSRWRTWWAWVPRSPRWASRARMAATAGADVPGDAGQPDDAGHIRPATDAERADVAGMHAANRAAWDEAAERYEGWFDEAVAIDPRRRHEPAAARAGADRRPARTLSAGHPPAVRRRPRHAVAVEPPARTRSSASTSARACSSSRGG